MLNILTRQIIVPFQDWQGWPAVQWVVSFTDASQMPYTDKQQLICLFRCYSGKENIASFIKQTMPW